MFNTRNSGWGFHITCSVALQAVKWGEREKGGSKEIQDTVVSNVALYNIDFSDYEFFCKMYLHKGIKYLRILYINSWAGHANSSLSSPSENKVRAPCQRKSVKVQQHNLATDAFVMQLLIRLSSCYLSTDLHCVD